MEMEIYARKNQISCIWRDIQTFKSSYNYKLAPLIGTSFGQPLYDKLRVTWKAISVTKILKLALRLSKP